MLRRTRRRRAEVTPEQHSPVRRQGDWWRIRATIPEGGSTLSVPYPPPTASVRASGQQGYTSALHVLPHSCALSLKLQSPAGARLCPPHCPSTDGAAPKRGPQAYLRPTGPDCLFLFIGMGVEDSTFCAPFIKNFINGINR